MFVWAQVYDEELIKLIRQKVKLMQPYAGAFLKKEDGYEVFLETFMSSSNGLLVFSHCHL